VLVTTEFDQNWQKGPSFCFTGISDPLTENFQNLRTKRFMHTMINVGLLVPSFVENPKSGSSGGGTGIAINGFGCSTFTQTSKFISITYEIITA